MSQAPRIVRAAPRGAIRRPAEGAPGIPVFALIRWYTGDEEFVPATAVAWTTEAVEVLWEAPELGMRSDWLPADHVSRHDPRRGENAPVMPQVPPRKRPGPRARW